MKRCTITYLLMMLYVGLGCPVNGDSNNRLVSPKLPYPEGATHEAPLLMVHYMSWFTTKPISGEWAFFWTMKNRNPENIDDTGRREIASHYYPITGPYDLSDPDILEYHVLLMKLTGIDGIIVNWAGIIEQGLLARHPEAKTLTLATENVRNIIEYCKRAGLLFVLNFEDRAALRIAKIPLIGGHTKALVVTQQMLRYADDLWLHDPAYVTVNSRPVFTFFGPFYFTNRQDFQALFSGLKTTPLLLTAHPRFEDIGQFYWLPVGPGSASHVGRQALEAHMQHFQQRAAHWPYRIVGATPGFHDYWVEGGEHAVSFGFIAHNNGATLRWTLDKALESSPEMIQIITWNDYAEGTMIEPTREFGTTFLEILQEFTRTHRDPMFPYSAEDLQIPFQIYTLRKNYAHNALIQARLDTAFALIVRDDLRAAVAIINTIQPRSTSARP